MINSNNSQNNQELFEALEYKDMVGLVKPDVHVDEFASKMGDDDEIVVVSFFVRSKEAAKDLANWFEKGYEFVMDADTSPGEIRPGRFLVYVEMRRRTQTADWINDLIIDLGSLTELEPQDWTMTYERKTHPWSPEEYRRLVPQSPRDYRQEKEGQLNEMRIAAGLDPVQIYQKRSRDIRQLQAAAGI